MATVDITCDRLRECLAYNQDTGIFTWIKPTSNRIPVGFSPTYTLNNGYMAIRIDGKLHTSHRLAWLYCHGRWPSGDIDHINGVRCDNRLCNLRDVSGTINNQNQRIAHADSIFGFLGVSGDKKRFSARIQVDRKRIHIGNFDSPQEAREAYLEVKRKLHQGNTL